MGANISDEEKARQPSDVRGGGAAQFANRLWQPVLELTHNHGTGNDENFAFHTGNSDPQGFGHIGFLVDDLDAMCAEMEAAGVTFSKKTKRGENAWPRFRLGSKWIPRRVNTTRYESSCRNVGIFSLSWI